MSDQELAETIEKEAAQHIPFDLSDVSLDYQILSDEVAVRRWTFCSSR